MLHCQPSGNPLPTQAADLLRCRVTSNTGNSPGVCFTHGSKMLTESRFHYRLGHIEQGQLHRFGRGPADWPPLAAFPVCCRLDRGGSKSEIVVAGVVVDFPAGPIRRGDRLPQSWWNLRPMHGTHELARLDVRGAAAGMALHRGDRARFLLTTSHDRQANNASRPTPPAATP